MTDRLVGRLQSGKGDASRWLSLYNEAYSRKLGMAVFPGSLNIALEKTFDWFRPEIQRRTIRFGREEYGGQRDVLLVRCVLDNLSMTPAYLWTPTTAARDRLDPWVVELIASVNLRATYGLTDGDLIHVGLVETHDTRTHANADVRAAT